MKKILLTNYNIANYTGSELDTVTIANYLVKKKYNVTIFTMDIGYPLFNELNQKVKIYDYDDIDKLDDHYDLLWGHHYPLVDFLIFKRKIKFDYIHYVSLSSYEAYESLPDYYQDLSYVSTLSEEAKNTLMNNGFNISKIKLFKNYSFEDFFNTSNQVREKIKKICIVSNHVPQELLDFKQIANNNGIDVDIYGYGYKVVKIDKDILCNYDVVISIAKTINYTLSLGVPSYCYDRFGGDGYIKKDNVKESIKYNFSGRAFRKKLTGQEIYNDIIDNYEKVKKDLNYLRKFAYNNFCFEEQLSRTLEKIFKSKKVDYELLNKKYSKSINKYGTHIDIVGKMNKLIKKFPEYPQKKCKVYYDIGNGINEKDSKEYIYRMKEGKYYASIYIPKKSKHIRFDYTDLPFMQLFEIKIDGKSVDLEKSNIINVFLYNESYVSINDDPSIMIEELENRVHEITVTMDYIEPGKIIKYLDDENATIKDELRKNKKKKISKFIKKNE